MSKSESSGLSGFLGEIQKVINVEMLNNEQCREKYSLICLLTFALGERNIIPQIICDDVQNQISKDNLIHTVIAHLPLILEDIRSQKSYVVNLPMMQINSSLRFDVLVAKYGNEGAFKVTLTNRELTTNTTSLVYDMTKYILSNEDGIQLHPESFEDFATRTRESLLSSILSEWHVHHCRLPSLVSESTHLVPASHLKIALKVLEQNPDNLDRDFLLLLIFCVLSEREIIPQLLRDLINCGTHQSFSYNRDLCESVAKNSSVLLSWAKKNPRVSLLRIPMTHKNSDLSFDILIAPYGNRTFKVTFLRPAPSTATLSSVFAMARCLSFAGGNLELKESLQQYAATISDSLLYPILTSWWQSKDLYTRLPYVLGIPENCSRKILQYLPPRDRKNYRLTSRRLMNIKL